MEVEYDASFTRDLRRIRNQQLFARVQGKIQGLRAASTLGDVSGLRKLHTGPGYYRIRIGVYRLGFELQGNRVTLISFRHRRDFYRSFP